MEQLLEGDDFRRRYTIRPSDTTQGTANGMTAIDQHLLKIRSPVDGMEIPFHVSAPSPLPKSPIPLVFLLHDSLADPPPGAFIEQTFQTASEWSSILAGGPPTLLVQLWGRGNAGWFGPAGRALFDVWNELEDQFLLTGSAALFGIGSGGCGAIQLSGRFPERFHATAAVNPWSDERLFLPFGIDDHPVWEADARKAVRPTHLASRLVGKAVALAHVPLADAFRTQAAKRHFDCLVQSLNASGTAWRDFSTKVNPFSEKPATVHLPAMLRMLVEPPQASRPVDREKFAPPSALFWRSVSIVVGTLGETSEIDAMRRLAERIRERWLSGEDSCNLAPGDRRLVQEIPIVADSEAVKELPAGDLVVLGSPRLSLLSARWKDRLPISWPSNDSDEFVLLGRAFSNPAGFAAASSARPDGAEGRVWIVAAGSEEAWIDVDRVRFAFLPGVFVQPKPDEILWMNDERE
jgi:hypothetical protein